VTTRWSAVVRLLDHGADAHVVKLCTAAQLDGSDPRCGQYRGNWGG